ncbi:DUF6933 domain-containing protein [Paenibacillus sinopodophylli]|uniref:DUF6933 domain-containing protein n=1 Tax=Paenibacillus sinopodophylli TaxID=1837342 RepID=UPI00110CA9EF|nr:hypothetical protein [Paenibacillus sinopodophylli]
MIIQCTKKLAAELQSPLTELQPSFDKSIYGWHAHLFLYKRKKCMLIMNNETRYNFIIYGLVKADFKRLNAIILEHLQDNLLRDGANQALIDTYLSAAEGISYTPTSNRSIISQVNEMIMVAGDELDRNMNLFNEPKPEEANRFFNRYVFHQLSKAYSGEKMLDALEELKVSK